MKAWTTLLLAALISVSMLVPANARARSEAPLAYFPGDKTFNVTNEYYTLVFDLEHGARLKAWLDAKTGKNYIGCGDYYPSLSLIVMAERPSATRHIGNLTVDYPYPLMLEPWSYKVLVRQDDVLVVEFYPANMSVDAERQAGGIVPYRVVAFYRDRPYIDVRYVLTNPTNHTVTLSRIDDKPGGVLEEISLLVGREGRASKNWSPVAAYMDGNRVPVSVFNLSVAGEIARRAFWVGFLNNATQEFAGMVVLEPELAASFGFRSGYYGQPALLAYVKYGRVEIGPGEAVELSARVYYGEGNYKWLDEAGFWGLSPLLAPEDYRKYRSIADNPGNATSIAEAYAKLKREVEDLRENNTSLQVRVNELEGECHKQLIQLRDYQDLAEHLNKVKASLENQRYLAFIAGMLAGLLVLYLGIKAGALGTGR